MKRHIRCFSLKIAAQIAIDGDVQRKLFPGEGSVRESLSFRGHEATYNTLRVFIAHETLSCGGHVEAYDRFRAETVHQTLCFRGHIRVLLFVAAYSPLTSEKNTFLFIILTFKVKYHDWISVMTAFLSFTSFLARLELSDTDVCEPYIRVLLKTVVLLYCVPNRSTTELQIQIHKYYMALHGRE